MYMYSIKAKARPTCPAHKHYLLLTISLRTTHCAPLTTHHSPRTTHHAPLTTHHAPRTTHHDGLQVPTRYDGGNTARTSAKKKTLNPEWDETLDTLHVYDAVAPPHVD